MTITEMIDNSGKSMAQIARETGLSLSHISRLRARRRMPSAVVAIKLALVLKVEVNDLMHALVATDVPARSRADERRAA